MWLWEIGLCVCLSTCLHQLLMEISIELELILVAWILLWLVHVVVHSSVVLSLWELWMIPLMSRAILVHSHHALVLLIHQIILVHVVMEVVVVADVGCSINQAWILE